MSRESVPDQSKPTELRVVQVPMRDTGIGREMGYANDAEFIEAANAEREAALSMLTPETRRRFEQAEEEATRAAIVGAEPNIGEDR